ncbi:MAG TPA: hypothetical protein P5186_11665 [Candidatus Paceibacterota bacterium]|nr:hypothetical protein [Verrucomicrobiota bacterium]HRY48697.1 hypothetical protein [Candidatus Paceibacterota bacterium]HSA01919.1 hypothetical protein [Candidatus Paceibacterota bacterium]
MKIDHELLVEPGQNFVVDSFKPEDALGVASLFYSIYGSEYPFETYYIPEKIIEENSNGNVYTVVARTAKGDIIGHGALYRSSPPNKALYEVGQYLVLKSYRHTFAAFKINKYIAEVLVPKVPLCGYFGEAVTHHVATQKTSLLVGAKEAAIELELMPAASYEKEAGTKNRITCINYYQSVRDRPQRFFVPGVYRNAIEYLLSGMALDRELAPANGTPPAGSCSRIDSRFFRFAGVGRLNVESCGADFDTVMSPLEAQAKSEQIVVLQCFLNLDQPWVGAAVECLRSKGFCLGGYLPRWFETDGLLMQKINHRPAFDSIMLHSERARALMQFVRQDWDLIHL